MMVGSDISPLSHQAGQVIQPDGSDVLARDSLGHWFNASIEKPNLIMKLLSPRFLLLSGVALAAPALADRVARRVAAKGYSAWTGGNPPRNPATPGVTWGQAIVWTAIAGAIGGVARMALRKVLSNKGLPAEE